MGGLLKGRVTPLVGLTAAACARVFLASVLVPTRVLQLT